MKEGEKSISPWGYKASRRVGVILGISDVLLCEYLRQVPDTPLGHPIVNYVYALVLLGSVYVFLLGRKGFVAGIERKDPKRYFFCIPIICGGYGFIFAMVKPLLDFMAFRF